ncbi:MAG: hypothetical protein HY900_23600 [Deltaproteobacteria bacterium]|nr:hypothetical protein [Deltaproteobacteria bacterium]
MKDRFRSRRATGALLTFIAAALYRFPARAADFQGCYRCHEGTLTEETTRPYIHSPFGQGRCAACHTAPRPAVNARSASPADRGRSPAGDERRRIQWLGESVAPDTVHWFVLPGARARDTVVVETRGSGAFSRYEVPIPRLSDLPEARDAGRPPAISGVRVLEVQRGLFLSATIAWETDGVTDAAVRYGKNDLKQSSPRGGRLGRRHQVVLYDLEPDKTYRFSVVSADLFGRQQASEPLTFSTSRPLAAAQPPAAAGPLAAGERVALSSRFQRVGADYLLEVTVEKPVSVSAGLRDSPQKQKAAGAAVSADVTHRDLTSRGVASIDACKACHQDENTATHPVNVYPKPGMVIPPEYPTLSDGRITCASCHDRHASNNPYLLIKARQRDLCIGCHRNMK